jgi:hypothetical protein
METISPQNNPFLIYPKELWYGHIPHLSYRDLVNLFLTVKAEKDFEEANQNFELAKRIWCGYAPLTTIVDTLYHAAIKKAHAAFESIITTRNEVLQARNKILLREEISNDKTDERILQDEPPKLMPESVDVHQNIIHDELLSLLNDLEQKEKTITTLVSKTEILFPQGTRSDYQKSYKKIACISIKRGDLELLKKCLDNLFPSPEILEIECDDLAEKDEEISILATPCNVLGTIFLELFDFALESENCLALEVIINYQSLRSSSNLYKTLLAKLILSPSKILCHFLKPSLEPGKKHFLISSMEDIIIRACKDGDTQMLNGALNYDYNQAEWYGIKWELALRVALRPTQKKSDVTSFILTQAPLPRAGKLWQTLYSILKQDRDEEFIQILSLLHPRRQHTWPHSQSFLNYALLKKKTKIAKVIFECFPDDINLLLDVGKKFPFNSPQDLAQNYSLFIKNAFIIQQTLSNIARFFPFPNDLEWRDFNLFSSSETRLDLNGCPLTTLDKGNKRIYICPASINLLKKSLLSAAFGVIKIVEAICMVAEHIFKLIKAMYEKDWDKMTLHIAALMIVPLAVAGMEAAILLTLIAPWRGSKLYFACNMSIERFAPSYFFKALYFDPSFLHRPVSKDYIDT